MKVRIAALAAVLVLSTSSFSILADDYDTFGAIAYSKRTHRYGYSSNEGSRRDAEQTALGECRASDCRIQVWFRNSCAAFAVGNGGDATGWAYDQNPRKARLRALNECKKRANDCRVLIEACSSEDE